MILFKEKALLVARFLCLLILASLISVTPVQAEITIVKLSYANPDSVIATLKSLYGRKLEASSATMINAIVVRTKDKEILAEIKKLVKSLDRRLSILRFSFKNISTSNSQSKATKYSNRSISFHRSNRKSNNNQQAVHSIAIMEFQKASLTNSISRVVPMGYEGPMTMTVDRGLQISGHLVNSNSVIVNLWFSAGSFSDSSTLVTTLTAPIGEWFQIGTNQIKNNDKPMTSTSIKNSNIVVSRDENKSKTEQNFLIKVDLIQPNY